MVESEAVSAGGGEATTPVAAIARASTPSTETGPGATASGDRASTASPETGARDKPSAPTGGGAVPSGSSEAAAAGDSPRKNDNPRVPESEPVATATVDVAQAGSGQAGSGTAAAPEAPQVNREALNWENGMQAEKDTMASAEHSESSNEQVDESLATTEPVTTFGRWLADARERRGLTLDDVVHTTKIRRAILEALERGAHDELPERVFVTGYVRSYASAVGLDITDAVRRFSMEYPDENAEELSEENESARAFGWMAPLAAALLALAAAWFIITQLGAG